MFLNQLTNEEKVSFLNIAHHIAKSDGDFSGEQKDIISQYCTEMQISDISEEEQSVSYKDSLGNITNIKSQKIILLEVMALIYSDDYMHIEEKKILKEMLINFNISDSLAAVFSQWSKSILALYSQANHLVEL